MKHLKLFEEVNKLPKVGDWAVASIDVDPVFGPNQKSEIYGEVIQVGGKLIDDVITISNGNIKRTAQLSKLKYWSNNKEELDIYIQSNKYNL